MRSLGPCYRDGEVDRLLRRVDQLEKILPLQTMCVQFPLTNTSGGFELFNRGVTDFAHAIDRLVRGAGHRRPRRDDAVPDRPLVQCQRHASHRGRTSHQQLFDVEPASAAGDDPARFAIRDRRLGEQARGRTRSDCLRSDRTSFGSDRAERVDHAARGCGSVVRPGTNRRVDLYGDTRRQRRTPTRMHSRATSRRTPTWKSTCRRRPRC